MSNLTVNRLDVIRMKASHLFWLSFNQWPDEKELEKVVGLMDARGYVLLGEKLHVENGKYSFEMDSRPNPYAEGVKGEIVPVEKSKESAS